MNKTFDTFQFILINILVINILSEPLLNGCKETH